MTLTRTRFLALSGFFSLLMGMATYASATASLTQVINKALPQVTLTESASTITPQGTATFTATLTGPGPSGPSGTVTFVVSDTNGNVILTSQPVAVNASGQAVWSTSLPLGTFRVAAHYAGDLNYSTGVSELASLVVTGSPDFSMSLSSLAPLKQGQSGQSTVTVAGVNGFNGDVQLTCTTDDSQVGCKFSNSVVSVAGHSQITVSTVPTTVIIAGINTIGIFALLGIIPADTRSKRLIVLLLLCSLILLCAVGCGTPHRYTQTDGTPPGTYYVTITGTSGSLTHSVNLQVLVKKP